MGGLSGLWTWVFLNWGIFGFWHLEIGRFWNLGSGENEA